MRAAALALLLLAPLQAFAAPPKILVQKLDFYDTSIDQRPFLIADQTRWLAEATAVLRRDIQSGGKAEVIDSPKARALMASLGQDYEHPANCPSCILSAARALGARYVLTAAIHKISDLICYMQGEVDDVRTGKPVFTSSTEVKADNKTMWLRAAHALAVAVNERF